MLAKVIETIFENNPQIEKLAQGHNCGVADFQISEDIVELIQNAIRVEFGDVVELYHGSDEPVNSDMVWRDNSSFTNEFDLEFAGEDGYIVVAQVPVERIKFYLGWENEFVVTAGKLDCQVFTVKEYFDLDDEDFDDEDFDLDF
jgi:hypothetical protein